MLMVLKDAFYLTFSIKCSTDGIASWSKVVIAGARCFWTDKHGSEIFRSNAVRLKKKDNKFSLFYLSDRRQRPTQGSFFNKKYNYTLML
jgi:hypothetical protein